MVWKLFIHICLGVEHMHYKHYIHRDLKTLNIFLTKENIARVGDLGLAMKIEEQKINEDENIVKLDSMNLKDEEQKQSDVEVQ